MKFRGFTARFALMAACALMTAAPAQAQFWQCAMFARTYSGIDILANAKDWWGKAAGRYERGSIPQVGAVMAFAGIGRMPLGHVATVSAIVGPRELLLTHANWSRRGQIEYNVKVVDVSPNNDWSQVRVWNGRIGAIGGGVYPIRGFIYKGTAPTARPTMVLVNYTAPGGVRGPVTLID